VQKTTSGRMDVGGLAGKSGPAHIRARARRIQSAKGRSFSGCGFTSWLSHGSVTISIHSHPVLHMSACQGLVEARPKASPMASRWKEIQREIVDAVRQSASPPEPPAERQFRSPSSARPQHISGVKTGVAAKHLGPAGATDACPFPQ
jgi:hypothetical protein